VGVLLALLMSLLAARATRRASKKSLPDKT
jgi:hypothetical protein